MYNVRDRDDMIYLWKSRQGFLCGKMYSKCFNRSIILDLLDREKNQFTKQNQRS